MKVLHRIIAIAKKVRIPSPIHNSSGITINIYHDDMKDEQYFVSEFKIGDQPLYCGEETIFHDDFSDDIKFRVILDKIEVENV